MQSDFMFTVAGQKFCANIASIAQSLRAIAEELKKANDNRKEQKDGNNS